MTTSDIGARAAEPTAGGPGRYGADLAVIAGCVSEITGLPVEAVVPEAHLIDDLYIDSVAKVELMVACETNFGVAIPDEVIADLQTVHSVLLYLASVREAA